MTKAELKKLQQRAAALEITITGDEDAEKLQELIKAEMESLGTWDGDYFNDKTTQLTEGEKSLKDVIEECDDQQLKQLLDKLGIEGDEAADNFREKALEDILVQEAKKVASAISELATEEKGETKDNDGTGEPEETQYKLAEGDTVQSILSDEDDEAIRGVADQLGIKEDKEKGWRKRTIENILEHEDNKVVGIMIELGVLDAQEEEEEPGSEEGEELSDEELDELMEKISASVEALDYYKLKDLCSELEIKPGGKAPVLGDRLLAYEDHDTKQLAAAIEKLDLWVQEVSEEAEIARKQRERRVKLEAMKDEGIPAMLASIRLFQSIGEYEDALTIAVNGEELWPKSMELRDLRKSIETQISEKAEAATEYEREEHSKAMEKKHGKRGRKAKVSTIQDCRDSCNDLIIVTKSTMKALAAEGKANRRLHYAVQLLGRMLKIQYK